MSSDIFSYINMCDQFDDIATVKRFVTFVPDLYNKQ